MAKKERGQLDPADVIKRYTLLAQARLDFRVEPPTGTPDLGMATYHRLGWFLFSCYIYKLLFIGLPS